MPDASSRVFSKTFLKGTTFLGFAALAAFAPPASAQQDTQTAQAITGIEEITVTARRREENIQEVPISITTFSAEDLREKNITTSRQLGELTPTYTENPVYGRDGGGFERIRGLPGVRSYFAEAPIEIGGRGGFYDMENVQVLVGPQGTLFGINAIGGAILREPKRPTNELEGYAMAGYDNYNHVILGGAINAPVIEDKLMARFAVQREIRDGFTIADNTGIDMDDVDYIAYRVGITFRPFENVENYFVWDVLQSDTNGPSRFLRAVAPNGFTALVFGGAGVLEAVEQQEQLGKSRQLGSTWPADEQFLNYKFMTIVNSTTWDVTDQFTLKNIFS